MYPRIPVSYICGLSLAAWVSVSDLLSTVLKTLNGARWVPWTKRTDQAQYNAHSQRDDNCLSRAFHGHFTVDGVAFHGTPKSIVTATVITPWTSLSYPICLRRVSKDFLFDGGDFYDKLTLGACGGGVGCKNAVTCQIVAVYVYPKHIIIFIFPVYWDC
jgi:hypothetical protein